MALRHSEESEKRLRPEEARAFLQIHAEREAAASTDSPTVEDLAETLGLSPAEAQAILREARGRVQVPVVEPKTSRFRRIAPLLLASFASIVVFGGLIVGFSARRHSANKKVWVHIDRGPKPFATSASVAARMSSTPPPDGFMVVLKTATGTYGAGGPTLNTGIEYGQLDPLQAATVKSRLVASVVDLLRLNVPEAAWNELGNVTLTVNIEGRPLTNLVIPVPVSNVGEEKEALRGSLEKIVEAAWPQIVRR